MPAPIQVSAEHLDLSPRLFHSTTVAASPAAATITVVASVTIPGDIALMKAVYLAAQAAWTVGTNGVLATWELRRTDATGTVVGTTGATTAVAASVRSDSVLGIDTGATLPGQVYALCLTVGSGSAASTVSAVRLVALVV